MSVVAKRLDGLRWYLVLVGKEVGLGPGDCARWGSSSLSEKKAQPRAPTQHLAHVYCGQLAGWINMPLGTEVNLGPGDVLDGVDAPLKRHNPPVFGPCLLFPNGWTDEDATWYGSRPQPKPHFVRRVPSSLPWKGTAAPSPSFRPMSIVATVAHLNYCWALVAV